MGARVEIDLVATTDAELGAAVASVGGIVDPKGVVATDDVAQSVDPLADGLIEDSILVGLPKVDAADFGAADDISGHEVGADGPGGGVGVVEVVGIGAANFAVGIGGEDGATVLGCILLESRGCGGAAGTYTPNDVGGVVEVASGAVVEPRDGGLATGMGEVGLDDGAGIVADTGDEAAVGADGDGVDGGGVEAAVGTGEIVEFLGGAEYATVSADVVEEIGILCPFAVDDSGDEGEGRDDAMDAGVDIGRGVVDGRHEVAAHAHERVLTVGGVGPLVEGAGDVALADPDFVAGDDEASGVGWVNSHDARVAAGGVEQRGNGAGGDGAPVLLVGGEVDILHAAVGVDGHGVDIGGVGRRDGEADALGVAECIVGGGEAGYAHIGGGHVADAEEFIGGAEVGEAELAGDFNLVDSTFADALGRGVEPVADIGGVGNGPAVEAERRGGEEIHGAVIAVVVVVDAVDGPEVGAAGLGQEGELGRLGVEAEEAPAAGRHTAIVGGRLDKGVAGAEIEGSVGALHHAGDGEDHLAAVGAVGDVVPNGGVGQAFGLFIGAADGEVEVLHVVALVRTVVQATGNRTSEEGGASGVAHVDNDARHLTADIGGADFVENAILLRSGLGASNASGQSHQAHYEAEQYFVSFHK